MEKAAMKKFWEKKGQGKKVESKEMSLIKMEISYKKEIEVLQVT